MQLEEFIGSSIFPRTELAPRQRQVLDALLQGDSEKQVARRLKISEHTVHVYVKSLYVAYNASSRGELMARFIPPRWRNAICRPN